MRHHCFALACLAANAAFAADQVVGVEFTSTPAPRNEAEMVVPYTRSTAVVRYASGATRAFPLRYEILFRPGDRLDGGEAGLIVDARGRPLERSPADAAGTWAPGPFHAFAPDANTLIRWPGASGDKLYLVTHYEYHTEAPAAAGAGSLELYARLPMAMSLTTLVQDADSGRLTARRLRGIDMSGIDGLWIPCAGSLTPWNTHLGGEEYEPDARRFENEPLEAMNQYLGTPGRLARDGGADPYRYGHPVEVKVSRDGTAAVSKRYAMGRLSWELAEVMPDERTAYMGDDGRDTMMFMFVADRPRDLSAGTLYAARWEQTAAEHGGAANLVWIRLGHATEAEIRGLIDRGIRHSDIFETADAAQVAAEPARHEGFRPVLVYEGHGRRASGKPVWLRVKPGMEQAAAFLESRRYGAWLGATSEFTKMEGVTHNAEDRRLYVAMSYLEAGMIDGGNGERPQDHIRLQGDPQDLACGAVYEARLAAGQSDSSGRPIDSGWVATAIEARLLGAKKPFGQRHGAHDRCDTERLANPDNIKYSPQMRTLFIGEDSHHHLNNFLWAYKIDTGSLTRLLSAPVGAELTGLAVVADLNGHGYILANLQHPGAAADLRQYPEAIRTGLRQRVDPRGAVGYLGGLPALPRRR